MKSGLNALEIVLDTLQEDGVETRNIHFIESDIKSAEVIPVISLIRNDKFEVEYNVETKEIRFSTTHSNQTIDDNFVNEMLVIRDSLPKIERIINSIFNK